MRHAFGKYHRLTCGYNPMPAPPAGSAAGRAGSGKRRASMPPPSAARASRAALKRGCVTPIAPAVLRVTPSDVVVVSQVQRPQPQRRSPTLDQRPMYAGFRLVLSRLRGITGAERRQGPARSGIDLHRRRSARHPLQLLAQVRTSLSRVHTLAGIDRDRPERLPKPHVAPIVEMLRMSHNLNLRARKQVGFSDNFDGADRGVALAYPIAQDQRPAISCL